MFAHDHLVPRVPQPTSFDGVKPSFLEWSEEVIAYLAFTDNQEFFPLLSAAAASKDVIEKNVMFKGDLAREYGEYRQSHHTAAQEQDKVKAQTENKMFKISRKRSKKFKERLMISNQNWSRRCQHCSKQISFSGTHCFMRLQATQMSWSGESCELLIQTQGQSPDWRFWRQMSIHCAGSAKTRTVSFFKQIMSPVEWNAEKSKDVIQQYHHWLELISKYEAVSSEKISDTVKITLALQNV